MKQQAFFLLELKKNGKNFDARYGQEPSNPVWQLDMFQKVSERCRCAAVPAVSDKVLQHSRAAKEIRKVYNVALR